jgi:hypothetical protein
MMIETGNFFMRVVFTLAAVELSALKTDFSAIETRSRRAAWG